MITIYHCDNDKDSSSNIIIVLILLAVWVVDHRSYYALLLYQPFILDCRLNDPGVPVLLYGGKSLVKLEPKTYPLIAQNGQTFAINVSALTSFGSSFKFECRALNGDGQLILRKEMVLSKARGLNKIYVIVSLCF